MKAFLAVLFCAVAVSALPQKKYTDRYDTINLDEVLSNRRLLIPYIKCNLDVGRCSPEGKELKFYEGSELISTHIKEALENYCASCTNIQKNGTKQVIGHLINHEKDFWDQLTAKYDPQHKYVKKYEDELRVIH